MTTTIFDLISHADFLRLTLEAFSRQGYVVEQSREADADAVLLGKSGDRIGILCKKYRSAIIGRPVLQQFHGALVQLHCTEGYLITTTECSPEARAFAADKGIVLYNFSRTTEMLRTAFGEEFLRTGKVPALGSTAAPAARHMASAASYEKGVAADLNKTPEPETPEELNEVPELVQVLEPLHAPEPEQAAEQIQAPAPAPGPEQTPRTETTKGKPAEDAQQGQSSGSPAEDVPSANTTIIVCTECNNQLRVPIDQGVITVTCPECGIRRIYQPLLNSAGELITKTIITCTSCSQKLNVPTNRGQLNVRCPQCKAAWVFTP